MLRGRAAEDARTADLVALASQEARHGHRRITAIPRDADGVVNVKRVERIRRWEGLGVPSKHPEVQVCAATHAKAREAEPKTGGVHASFGLGPSCSWDEARHFGFVGAGGGTW